MVNYLIKKLLILFFSLFLVITVTFFLMKAIPGDPFIQEKVIPQEILDALYKHYGLDKPLGVQYLKYLKGFVTGDLGPSFVYQGRTINDVIKAGLPISGVLGLEALFLSLFFGITLGSIAAWKRSTFFDGFATCFSVIGISVPSFLLATLLQYIFSIKLGILPVARWGSFAHTILPALALSALPTAFIARLIRSNMVEVLEQDYIKTALSKGLSMYKVITKHALRNAILPVITYLGPLTAHILTGSFVIEKIFGIPGLGQWFILSVLNRDYTLIMGMTVFFSAFLLTMIFFVDVLYGIIDPRMKNKEKKYDGKRTRIIDPA